MWQQLTFSLKIMLSSANYAVVNGRTHSSSSSSTFFFFVGTQVMTLFFSVNTLVHNMVCEVTEYRFKEGNAFLKSQNWQANTTLIQ